MACNPSEPCYQSYYRYYNIIADYILQQPQALSSLHLQASTLAVISWTLGLLSSDWSTLITHNNQCKKYL